MTDHLTDAELDELERKAKAATPGPWHRHRQGEITKGNYILANVNKPIRHGDNRDAAEFSKNLAHIAAAHPLTIQRLIAEVREGRKNR